MALNLPVDDPQMWPGIPLEGHICCIQYGEEKHYWTVKRLIHLSSDLSVISVAVDPLVKILKSGKWFGANQSPTIGEVLQHVERALKAEQQYPIILSEDGRFMDGSHRVIGAKLNNCHKISAIQFSKNPTPEYIQKITD